MRNKYEQQTDIVEDVKSGIEKAEAQRKQLRFNHNLLSLETGNSRVLANEEFLFGLVAFIKSLSFTISYRSNIDLVLCPDIFIATFSGIPDRTIFRIAVLLRS